MKALILAAGLGTRLRPYTLATPKPLFTLAGRPLLELHIRNLMQAGCEAVAVNTHHLHDPIATYIASQRFGIPVHLRHEPAILGTGGAIKNFADFWDPRPFMVINADIHATIDLKAVYEFHLRHRPAATLVLVDHPDFNSVTTDPAGCVREIASPSGRAPANALTFTGIQVLEPVVLDYIPAGRFSHSIDAFRAMIADGKCLRAYIPDTAGWMDLGTPDRYRQAAAEASAREAWRLAFGHSAPASLVRQPIAGDGSERQWSRWQGEGRTMVMVDHGLRTTAAVAEVDAFVSIGGHLRRRGVPVPAIYFADPFAGLVFLEDLGDTHLQRSVQREPERQRVMAAYRTVIDSLARMSVDGARGFDTAWAYQTPAYDREVVLERECLYFCNAFLSGYAGMDVSGEEFSEEFDRIADGALAAGEFGFMHRDLQSRNIMVWNGRFYFIDFQGGRLGPVHYDLASLLIDPYVGLTAGEQDRLLDYAVQRMALRRRIDREAFRRGFAFCALSRNLQILGAFGFLSAVKGKAQFSAYIPAALGGLAKRLADFGPRGFPKLQRAVAQAEERLGAK